MAETIKALIAARSGSLRVKNKNLRPFAGSNLLTIKIEQMLRIKELDGVVVNSNDDEILSVAKKLGCETVKRDQLFASNEICTSDFHRNIAENTNADIIVYANCTNPLLSDKTIYAALEKYYAMSDNYDSLNSAHPVKEFLFKDNKPINFDLRRQPRSQDLPDIFALNYAINITPRDTIIERKNVVGAKPLIYDIGAIEGTDIDNQIDFDFAEFYYNKLIKKQY